MCWQRSHKWCTDCWAWPWWMRSKRCRSVSVMGQRISRCGQHWETRQLHVSKDSTIYVSQEYRVWKSRAPHLDAECCLSTVMAAVSDAGNMTEDGAKDHMTWTRVTNCLSQAVTGMFRNAMICWPHLGRHNNEFSSTKVSRDIQSDAAVRKTIHKITQSMSLRTTWWLFHLVVNKVSVSAIIDIIIGLAFCCDFKGSTKRNLSHSFPTALIFVHNK